MTGFFDSLKVSGLRNPLMIGDYNVPVENITKICFHIITFSSDIFWYLEDLLSTKSTRSQEVSITAIAYRFNWFWIFYNIYWNHTF